MPFNIKPATISIRVRSAMSKIEMSIRIMGINQCQYLLYHQGLI